jgi:hypothetical protein
MGLARKALVQGLTARDAWCLWSEPIHITLKLELLQAYETFNHYAMQEPKTGFNYYYYYYFWLCNQARAMASSFTRFLDHTRRATVGRTPLHE